MKINNEFTVGVPVEEAWNAMLDLERIAPCLPGAAITEQDGDEYQGTMTVKIGPVTAKYRGNVHYEETDEANRRAVLKANGRDARGQGTASAVITSVMEDLGGSTKVSVETDMKLTGRAAQFGRGIAQDVASKMLGQFAECLEERLGSSNEESAEAGATEEAATPNETAEAADNATAPPASAGATQGTTVTPGGTPAGAASGSMAGAAAETSSLARPVGTSGTAGGTGDAASSTTAGGDPGTSGEKPKARKIDQPEPEPLDLGEMSQDAIMKRVKPVLMGVGALVALFVVYRLLRRKS
ncbi:Carbon monoxide dehydrogenase subunit G (CoxG) [Rubrobacter radiotolerans]|uniref:Carbon monoxide dehydrogenase subunit G (CoxG) n=1 Tax=Rubrobacter radiotolerans TaxID=42256 RepID=A0A023X783_RUBRA|nr:SRPBCC family protein [Rubrobacter radiotolerans]AHY47900.1 Carbon monoxide dehydrogenase subunit G (CoxG) [Rubrobacter radiotolerans]MDX5892539.1 SRPBCC family protein [Rubrobacter radiotolerans]SMC07830.1 Carbon monoxide dehydrogenase subunit G [Rubrobacter radiotolerans DSM 5868]